MIKKKHNILFITGITSPFWVEFADAINRLENFNFIIAFCKENLEDRGNHWRNLKGNKDSTYIIGRSDDLRFWLEKVILENSPVLVLFGGIRSPQNSVGRSICRKMGIRHGYISEAPIYRGGLIGRLSKNLLYKVFFRLQRPDIFLCIGFRSQEIFRKLLPVQCPHFFFPYSQDLSFPYGFAEKPIEKPVKFLFSGRLQKRNSVMEMIKAFEKLSVERKGEFTLRISGRGPEEKCIRDAMDRCQNLAEVLTFDRDFSIWEERLNPFRKSDILILPCRYSGWGLVVPEALASGMPVVTTPYVESARYFIEDMYNGMFTEPDEDSIYSALTFCLDRIHLLNKMRINTRESSRKGTADHWAKQFSIIYEKWEYIRDEN